MTDLAAHLSSTYGIEVRGLTRLDEGVLRVDRGDGPAWVARVFAEARPRQAVEGDAEALRFLEASGFPAERCARAAAVSDMDGESVLVTEFVEGKPPRGDEATLTAMGEMLGLLHTLPVEGAAGRDAGALHHWSPAGGLPGGDIDVALRWIRESAGRADADEQPAFEALRDALAAADACDDLPRAFIHPDFHLGNAIMSGNGEIVMVDWTGAGVGPRITSLALFLSLSVVRNPGGPGIAAVDAIAGGYRRHVTLERDELARLAGAVRKPGLVLDCWFVHRGYRTPRQVDEGLEGSARLADAIASRAREAFA